MKDVVTAAQHRARRGDIGPHEVAAAAIGALPTHATSLRRVINATGVIIHTNLGRAPLSPAARDALAVAAEATDVEFELSTGQRAPRGRGALDALAAAVPDAEAVHVVNNNAAALLLCALAFAAGREIIVSRGELVEIGDGFRIPDLLKSGGARLREVGTTNRTSLRDYAEAVGPQTAFILKVHPSNFVISGFTSAVGVPDLATLGPPVIVDIGSGLLAPHPLLPDEPDAATVLRDGAALVTASGDKLLGGPQAGLLLGQAELIGRLRRHPSARALRVDKLTLAALEATLTGPPVPVRVALEMPAAAVRDRAERLAERLRVGGIDACAVESAGVVGGGAAPGVQPAQRCGERSGRPRGRAAERPAAGGGSDRGWAMPARSAHRVAVRRRSSRLGRARRLRYGSRGICRHGRPTDAQTGRSPGAESVDDIRGVAKSQSCSEAAASDDE